MDGIEYFGTLSNILASLRRVLSKNMQINSGITKNVQQIFLKNVQIRKKVCKAQIMLSGIKQLRGILKNVK